MSVCSVERVCDRRYSGGGDAEIVGLCLQTMKLYISWIDIGLVVNDRCVPRLLSFLSVSGLREPACACFLEIVSKGMDDVARVQLIASLRIVDVLAGLKLDLDSDEDYGAITR